MTQFFHDDHGSVLIQRLVHGDHLAHLHQRLDDLRCLDGHLVRQLSHRDGFRHVHFKDARLHRSGLLVVIVTVIAVVATAPTRATTPAVATDTTAAVAAGLDFFFLGCVTSPAGGQLGRLDFLASGGTGRCWRTRTRGHAGSDCGLVQRALFGVGPSRRLGHRLGFFGLLGHHDRLLGRGHHGADGCRLGFGLAAACVEVSSSGCIFIRAGLGFGCGLFAGFYLCGIARDGFSSLFTRSFFLHGRGLCLLAGLLGGVGGGALFGFTIALLAGFAFGPFFGQLGLLAANQLCLAAGFFLAAGQFDVLAGNRGFFHHGFSGFGSSLNAFIALDKGALLAHFHLDGARLARGIGLLDFAGGLLHQRDLLAIGRSRAVAGLQVGQQLLLVRLGEGIGRGSLGHARSFELVEQGFRRFFEFGCKLGDSITGHIWFVPP